MLIVIIYLRTYSLILRMLVKTNLSKSCLLLIQRTKSQQLVFSYDFILKLSYCMDSFHLKNKNSIKYFLILEFKSHTI